MKFNLLIFIISCIFIIMGYVKQNNPDCKKGERIKYVPMSVYQELESEKPFLEID